MTLQLCVSGSKMGSVILREELYVFLRYDDGAVGCKLGVKLNHDLIGFKKAFLVGATQPKETREFGQLFLKNDSKQLINSQNCWPLT